MQKQKPGRMQKQNKQGRLEPGQNVINQSQIKWALGDFKPKNLAETDKNVRHSCSKE